MWYCGTVSPFYDPEIPIEALYCMVYAWCMHGVCMVYAWCMHGMGVPENCGKTTFEVAVVRYD